MPASVLVLFTLAASASAASFRNAKIVGSEHACAAEDLKHRAQLQNKLAGICEEMCKEVGAYPKCAQCPDFVAPDSTPGVVTWEELLVHMDNLVEWGQGMIKGWKKTASALQKSAIASFATGAQGETACVAEDLKHRAAVQNKLAGICVEMCKEVGAYPQCAQCPAFVAPDSTPGVMTWEELLAHMDNLTEWGQETIKSWKKQAASALQTSGNATRSGFTINDKVYVNGALFAESANIEQQLGCHPTTATSFKVCGCGVKVEAHLLTECQTYNQYDEVIGTCDCGTSGCVEKTLSSGYKEKFDWTAKSFKVSACR